MNAYEAKQEARRERIEAAAAKASAESSRAAGSASAIARNIPFGQPILVGHHSEGRHRRDAARIDNGFRKAHELEQKAERLQRKADAVGTAGVSSDDPEAVEKLKEKLASLEAKRDMMKTTNKAYRVGGWDAVGEALGWSAEAVERMKAKSIAVKMTSSSVFEAFELTNLGANIRNVKKRIEGLAAKSKEGPVADVVFEGFRVIENMDINRVQLVFDGRPGKETRALLKRSCFRWAPSEGAWQRQLNNAGRYEAGYVAKAIVEAGGMSR